jgi:hypothetical protein
MNHRHTLLTAILLTVTACTNDNATNPTPPTNEAATTPATPTTTAAGPNVTSTTASATSTTTPTPTASSTTAGTTSPTTSPGTTPPTTNPPIPTVSTTTIAGPVDWTAVIQTLGQRRQNLYATPDLSRIPEVCGDQSQCANQLNTQIGDLATKGWKVVDADPYTVLDAHVEKFDGDTLETSLLVTVIAVVKRPVSAGQIVDSTGATVASVVAETPVGRNTENRTILARTGPDIDPWRIVSQQRLREVSA